MEWVTNPDNFDTIAKFLGPTILAIVGWVFAALKRQWSKTEKAFDKRVADIKEDHTRDIAYYERRDRDQTEDIRRLRESLRECESRWNRERTFQI